MTSDADPSTLVSLTSSAGDFRELIEKKLAAKRSQLGQTEETIKKYIGDRDQLPPGPARFQNRLGPPPGQASQGPLGSRLGPRVGAQPASRYRDPDDDDVTPHRVGVMSRVVVEQKTREEVLAEKRASENKSDAQVRILRPSHFYVSLMISFQCCKHRDLVLAAKSPHVRQPPWHPAEVPPR